MYYMTTYPSAIGAITLACDGDSGTLVGLWTEGQKYHGGSIPEAMVECGGAPLLDKAKRWLDRYFEGKKPAPSELPLSPIGGDFRQDVWGILQEIPYGELTTYGEIAGKIAAKRNRRSVSARAVGGAVGHNPISIIIPCHRVIGANGSLTGYAGGLGLKAKLLELEGVDMSRFLPFSSPETL